MDQKEYEARLAAIEQMVETLARGYRRGNHFQIIGMLEESTHEHRRLYNGSDGASSDQCVDANASGYREGCCGTKVEGTS